MHATPVATARVAEGDIAAKKEVADRDEELD
jgi:hypothetical protein